MNELTVNSNHEKVLILAPFSHPSACGVWKRAYSDALQLHNAGYEVHVFTSNIIKATDKKSGKYEKLEGIHIHRFNVWFNLGGTAMFWYFMPKLIRLNPSIIHTHGFRHPHSLISLIIAKILRKKVFLTTHAPFVKDKRRSTYLKLFDITYDLLISWWELRLYNKVIRISKWEEKYIKKLGIKNSIYIPNGIEKEYINQSEKKVPSKPTKRVLYMGRVDPVKRVEWIIETAQKLPKLKFKIFGPIQNYPDKKTFQKNEIKNLEIIDQRYDKQQFINELNKSDIYVLPSIREALGITLLEAMAVGKIVIASDALGPSDFIEDQINGFIVKNPVELAQTIEYVYNNYDKMQKVMQEASKTAKQYSEEELGKELLSLYKLNINKKK